MICTFIGHRDTPDEIEPILKKVLKDLIEKHGVDKFYVGTHGRFDYTARKVLSELKQLYCFVDYKTVLAYLPQKNEVNIDYQNSILPDGFENIHPKFAIIKRNKRMIEKADFVVCYVTQDITNAYNFMKFAENKKKTVINIWKMPK